MMINPKLFHILASMKSAKEISLTDVLSDVSPSNKSSALASHFSLHSSQVASNIQTCQSDSSSMKNLSFRFCEVVACGLLCGPPLQPHILMT